MSATNEHPEAEAENAALSVEALQAEVERLKKLCVANNITDPSEDSAPKQLGSHEPEQAPLRAKPEPEKPVTNPADSEKLKAYGRGYHLLQEAAKRQNEHEAKLAEALGKGSLSALPLLRQVTISTFQEAVLENMENFDMTEDEARREAVDQFKQQGVDATHFLSDKSEQA